MTPQEKDLIMSVANRLRSAELPQKDAEAANLIDKEIAGQPDSIYLLTQAVLIQEHALKQAQARISSLDQERQALEAHAAVQPKGGFLGGLFGGESKPASTASRPMAAAPRTAAAQAQGAAPGGGGFGEFMKSAASVALGVAGGHLLFSGLGNLFDGSSDAGVAEAAEASPDPEAAGAETGGGWGTEPHAGDAAAGWGEGETLADGGDGWGQSDGVIPEQDQQPRFGEDFDGGEDMDFDGEEF